MSKSEPDGAVFLLDNADDIRRKIRRAVTDSDAEIRIDIENKPGVSNLLQIYSAFSGESTDEAIGRFEGQGYGQLKKGVADAVIAGVEPIQKRYQELIADKGMLHQQMMNNAERARQIAARTLRKVYKKVGLYQG
jgi:tryptophanyl-tRNA synthetase